jgi:LysM repeat protein
MQFVMLLLRQIITLACQFIHRGGATVLLHVRPLLIISATMLILVACTRERPTPEPTATTAVQANAPATAAVEAQIITDTSQAGSNPGTNSGTTSDAGLLAPTNTPNPLTPAPGTTSTPGAPDTFQYVVQDGDTLGSIADRFETDIDTLRSLNNLNNDSLAVGQPLYVPYKEGITAEGLPTPTPGPFLYTIQTGDTLSGLAERFNVDTMSILEANSASVIDPNNLIVGTTISIPGYQPPAETNAGSTEEGADATPSAGEGVVHTVQAGQGLLEISAMYGVSVADIMAANNLTDQDILRIGQKLIIPGVTKRDVAAAQGNVHVVQSGESLLSIALLYGVTVEELQEANDLDNPDSIFVGQELIIPVQ